MNQRLKEARQAEVSALCTLMLLGKGLADTLRLVVDITPLADRRFILGQVGEFQLAWDRYEEASRGHTGKFLRKAS